MYPYDQHFDSISDDIPELPIPRPDELSSPPVFDTPSETTPLATPSLGTSYTSASDNSYDEQVDKNNEKSETAVRDLNKLTWELASQLTAGMLANPARSANSVKDAMSLFDAFLHEMHAYMRISTDLELDVGAQRRSAHAAYFRPESSGSADPPDGTNKNAA